MDLVWHTVAAYALTASVTSLSENCGIVNPA